MVYGPIAAALVELFPTRIRYTSMSLPYHIGNGWFGGLLPATVVRHDRADRRHLLRPLVPDRGRADDLRHRLALRSGDQGARHLQAVDCRPLAGDPEGRSGNRSGPFRMWADLYTRH